MNLSWKELLSKKSSSCYLVSSRERDIDIFSDQYPNEKCISRIIRGQNARSTKELFHEFSSALQFPYYFGKNWDAFDECIRDLDWLKGEAIVIFVTHTDMILSNEDQKEYEIFISVILNTIKTWDKETLFRIVFHTENLGDVNSKIKALSQIRELPPFDSIN